MHYSISRLRCIGWPSPFFDTSSVAGNAILASQLTTAYPATPSKELVDFFSGNQVHSLRSLHIDELFPLLCTNLNSITHKFRKLLECISARSIRAKIRVSLQFSTMLISNTSAHRICERALARSSDHQPRGHPAVGIRICLPSLIVNRHTSSK